MALIAVWGCSFVYSLAVTLSAPHRPLEFRYQSPGGELELTAESYAFDLQRGNLRFERPSLADPYGKGLASADYLEAVNLYASPESARAISVRASGLKAFLVRKKDGRIPLIDYLPKPSEQPSNVPFVVDVEGIDATVLDEAGDSPWTTHLVSPAIKVEGVGQQWLASGQASLSGIGSLDFQLEGLEKDAYRGDIEASHLDLTRAFQHFSSTPEANEAPVLKDFSVERLIASGPFSFATRPGTRLAFESTIDLSGLGVRYRQEPRADVARFMGYLSSTGVNGVLTASNSTADLRYEGSATWEDGIWLGGNLQGRALDARSIGRTLASQLPKQVAFSRGEYHGWLGYSKATGWLARGAGTARSLTAYGEQFALPSFDTNMQPAVSELIVHSASWHGAPLEGTVILNRRARTLTGAFNGSSVPLGPLAKRYGIAGLDGTGDVQGILGGSEAQPELELRAKGRASYVFKQSPTPVGGTFEIAAALAKQVLTVERALLRSEQGTLSARGNVDVRTKALALDVVGADIRPGAFSKDLGGIGALVATVSGTWGHPVASGHAEVFGGRYRQWELPVVAADLTADRQTLQAVNIRAVSGASEATGQMGIDLRTRALSGALSAKGVQLSDLIQNGPSGVLDISDAQLSGTLSHPVASATVKAQSIVDQGIKIDSASAGVELNGPEVRFKDLMASVSEGKVVGSGTYDLQSSMGQFRAEATGVQLGSLFNSLAANGTVLTGALNGKVSAQLGEKGLVSASGSGDLADVVVNHSSVGSGPWDVHTEDRTIKGSVQIGRLERFLELNNFAYDVDQKTVSGDINVLNLMLADAARAAEPYLTNLSQDAQDRVHAIDGNLAVGAKLSGVWPHLDFEVPTLTVDKLTYGDRPMGSIDAAFDRKGTKWDIGKLEWMHAATSMVLKPSENKDEIGNWIDEKGDLRLDGTLSNFDLTELALIDKRLGGLSGTADFSFLASGPSNSPQISASLDSNRFQVGAGGKQMEFGLMLDAINISESKKGPNGSLLGGITAEGKFTYRGLTGDLTSQMPFKYPAEIPGGEPLTAQIVLPQRPLASLSSFYAGVDPARTRGTISGNVGVFGSADALKARGEVKTEAESFAIKDVPSTLMAMQTDLKFEDDQLSLDFSSGSSLGGTATIKASSRLQDFGKLLGSIISGNEEDILDTPVTGLAEMKAFHIQDGGREGWNVDTVVNGDLNLGGTLAGPSVKGQIALSGANVLLPGKAIEQTGNAEYPVDPSFDVALSIADSARVRTSTANLNLLGNGKLQGTLSHPNLTAAMVVSSGTLRLPTARVIVQPDGTLNLLYQVGENGDLNARMDVDIEGRTSVTTLLYGDTIQRYDVTLTVTGDLFKEGGLNLAASSDPPDLSQDRILALLGQADVLQAFTGSVPSQEAQKQIRTALTGVALPVLLDPVTSRLASSLGLQYLNIEYNAYEQATFAFAKALGKNLILQGRRQLSEPVVGTRPSYDMRLIYRLPVKKGVLSRTTFSFGADQDRPWKIAVEYGLRF